MSNVDSTAFLNRFLSVMADILSEKYDADITLTARPKSDAEEKTG